MQRRKYLAAIGSLAAGGAAGIGTGAFTAGAERDARVEVVGDASAYLQITEGPNSTPIVSTSNDGEIKLNFGADSGRGSSGMNQDGHTEWHNIVTVKNTGTKTVWFGVETDELRDKSYIDDFNVFAHDDVGSPEYDSDPFQYRSSFPPTVSTDPEDQRPLIDLEPGDSVQLSFHFKTNDEDESGETASIYFIAVEKGGPYDNTQGNHDGD
jgi:hypothetical protein